MASDAATVIHVKGPMALGAFDAFVRNGHATVSAAVTAIRSDVLDIV
jgi:hypothetical protein